MNKVRNLFLELEEKFEEEVKASLSSQIRAQLEEEVLAALELEVEEKLKDKVLHELEEERKTLEEAKSKHLQQVFYLYRFQPYTVHDIVHYKSAQECTIMT